MAIFEVKPDRMSAARRQTLVSIAALLAAGLLHQCSVAQLPDYGWAEAFEGYPYASDGQVAVDQTGAIYWLSLYGDTLDLDPGPGVAQIIGGSAASGYETDGFLAKYSAEGEYLWHIVFKNAATLSVNDIAINDAAGTLALVGSYIGNMFPNPGPAGLGSSNNTRCFILEYGLDGQYLAHTTFPAALGMNLGLYTVAFAPDGDLVVGGGVYGTMDVDPVGVTNIVGGQWTGFVARYNHPLDLEWSFVLDGSWNTGIRDIAFTNSGDMLVSGGVVGSSVDFDPGPADSDTPANISGYSRAFLARYSPDNSLQWVNVLGYTSTRAYGFSVLHDATGAAYLMGYYDMPNVGAIFDLDPGAGEDLMPTSSAGYCYVAKYGTDGTYQWGYAYPPNLDDDMHYTTAHAVGQIVLFGSNRGTTLLFDSSGPLLDDGPCAARNPFFLSLSTDGDVLWHAIEGATCDHGHFGRSIAYNASGDVAILGNYHNTPDASFGTIADHLPDYAETRPYLMTFNMQGGTTALPAISSSTTTVLLTTATLFDMQGRLVHQFTEATSEADALLYLQRVSGAASAIHVLRGQDPQGREVVRKVAFVR
jgi:hypothetical protein